MPTPEVTSITLDPETGERFQPLRDPLGVRGFGINLITLQPRQRGRIHLHLRQEEVYLVLEGELTIAFDDGERTYREREIVRVPPELRRQLMNRSDARTVLVALGASGEHTDSGVDGRAWPSWDEITGEGVLARSLPAPTDLAD